MVAPIGTMVLLGLVTASTVSVLQSRSLRIMATRRFRAMSQEAASVARFVVTRRTLDDRIWNNRLALLVRANGVFISACVAASTIAEWALVDGVQGQIAGKPFISGFDVGVQDAPVKSR